MILIAPATARRERWQFLRNRGGWLLVASLALILIAGRAQAQNGVQGRPNPPVAAPDVRVEFFGAQRGYATGTESLPLLCVVRNVGSASLPENTLRVRCYAMTGLDYTTGETRPLLPALSPNQAVAFRWRLEPTDDSSPLVAAVLIESAGQAPTAAPDPARGGPNVGRPGGDVAPQAPPTAPQAVLIVVPHFASTPHLLGGGLPPKAPPQASVSGRSAQVGNDRVMARVEAAESGNPVLSLAARDGAMWRLLATGGPLMRVRAGEEGQAPWWETFHWHDAQVRNTREGATLTLTGLVGSRWRAEIVLESHPNTCVLTGHLRLTPRRVMRLYGVALPRLLAQVDPRYAPASPADGSVLPVAADSEPLADAERLAGAHLGSVTFGMTWTSWSALPDWHTSRLPAGDTSRLPVLGAQVTGPGDRGEVIMPGATLEFAFHLFAFTPSGTVRDALRFGLP